MESTDGDVFPIPAPPVATFGPESADVVVIGGGVIGCATAYYLAKRGIDVVVVERGELCREASGANAGTLHIQIPAFHFREQYLEAVPLSRERAGLFRATNRLYVEAARIWPTLETELRSDLGVRIGGGFMVAETPEDVALLRAKSFYENEVGIATEIMSMAEMLRYAPNLSPRLAGGSYYPGEGFANPLLVGPAFARRAQAWGTRIRRHSRVNGIEPGRNGGFQVDTTTGQLSARQLVVAAGAQTGEVAAIVGLDLPVRPHPLQVIVSEPWPPILTQMIQHVGRHLSLRQTQYGTFVIGGGWPGVVVPAAPRIGVSLQSIAGNARVACDALPALRDVRLLRAWGGMTTATGATNRVGFLGEYHRLPGFYVAVTGGWGFTLAPVLGRLMAELIAEGKTSLPIEHFDLDHIAAIV